MQVLESQCQKRGCKHYVGTQFFDHPVPSHTCKAFPTGIPEEIAYGENDHTQPFAGDNGIRFESSDGVRSA